MIISVHDIMPHYHGELFTTDLEQKEDSPILNFLTDFFICDLGIGHLDSYENSNNLGSDLEYTFLYDPGFSSMENLAPFALTNITQPPVLRDLAFTERNFRTENDLRGPPLS